MKKIKVGIIYGGLSTEHQISINSAKAIIENLDKNKYNIFKIYIDKDNNWYNNNKKIKNIIKHLQNLDIIFPVLHGKYGEDGTIQGMLEMFNISYVGCKVLASSLAMDKIYTKIVLDKAKIKQAKYIYLRKYKNTYIYIDEEFNENVCSLKQIEKVVTKKLSFPVFVKPSNSGSSVGVNKSNNQKELKKHIEYAAKFDDKILIEENIQGREIECAILEDKEIKSSFLGEIIPKEEFYSYDAKYKDKESKLIIPVKLNEKLETKIRKIAIKAFKAIDGKGLARIDFFVNDKTNEIYINEINTLPGFTEISMYPKLWQSTGIKFNELLDKIINQNIKS